MNFLIINTNRCSQPFPVMPLGACIAAEAAEKAGHKVHMLDLAFKTDPVAVLRKTLAGMHVDAVGLSIRNIDNNDMRNPVFFLEGLPDIIRTIRANSDAPLIIGGAAVGVMGEAILRFTGADYAVPVDGESVLPALLEGLEKGDASAAPGIARITDGVFHKNPHASETRSGCTMPEFHRWIDVNAYLSRMSTVPVQTKLGCRFKCIYCTYRKIEGEEYRLCSPECVVQLVQSLCSQGFRDIEFVDNVFNAPYEHAVRICRLLANSQHNARLQSLELNPLFVDDSLIDVMEQAGFTGVGITAESASDTVLRNLGKAFSSHHVLNASAVIKRHSIPCLWIFLLGGPGENMRTVEKTFAFAERLVQPKDAVFFNIGIRIYPGTELEAIARRQGVISTQPQDMLQPVFYISPELDPAWLSERAADFMKSHMNVIDSTALGLPFLPDIHKLAHKIGIRPPLWRHTPAIRRMLKYTGIYS